MLYPAFLDLKGRKCLVVGGGPVAERKINKLILCGAEVFVVSPKVTTGIEKLAQSGKLKFHATSYKRGHLKDIFMAFAATSDESVNRKIGKDAGALGIMVNVVDAPELGNLVLPASFRRGDIEFAVSTSSKAPYLSVAIKQELERIFPEGFEELLEIAEEAREAVRSKYGSQRKRGEVLVKLIDSEIIALAKKSQFKKIREKILDCI